MLGIFICIYLGINLLVGLWAAKRVSSTEDFVLAGRRLGLGLVSMVTFATWFGSETLLGAPGRFVEDGFLGVIEDPFGAGLCLILVGVFYARIFYRWNIITFCNFFGQRFGKPAEYLSAILIIPSYFGWIAAQLVAMSLVGEAVFGLPPTAGIWIGAGLVLAYTLSGGMWAVSITDFLHNILLIAGLVIVFVIVLNEAGGFRAVVNRTPEGFFRIIPHDFSWVNISNYLAGWMLIGLGSIPQQDIFQRVMAARNADTAVRSSILAGVLYFTVALLPLFIGLIASQLHPELLSGDTQLLLPKMVLHHAPIWVQILFFGALVSALLSTTSGAILAPAAVLGENLIKPFFKNISDKKLLLVIRLSVIGVTVASVWMAILRRDVFALVGESSAFSLVSLFIPMTAGLYWKRANLMGCLASMILGLGAWFYAEHLHTETPSIFFGLAAGLIGLVVGSWRNNRADT